MFQKAMFCRSGFCFCCFVRMFSDDVERIEKIYQAKFKKFC